MPALGTGETKMTTMHFSSLLRKDSEHRAVCDMCQATRTCMELRSTDVL